MEANFWHQIWERGELGFHQSDTNPFLKAHFAALHLEQGARVFLPLCGKTHDIAWLLAIGYRVVGAELSERAIQALFEALCVEPDITRAGELTLYSAKDLDLFVGDIFHLAAARLGPIDAVYDRAALVALPATLRSRYSQHLRTITAEASQLVITYEYDQAQMQGPPFSVSEEELKRHYDGTYRLKSLESREVAGGLKGVVASRETAWLLQKC